MQKYRRVSFLCTGNSCRSQMAEAIVKARPELGWQAFSVGTEPAGYVHPLAVQVLAEISIHHQRRSKSIAELPEETFDLVVTVCDSAAEECPAWFGQGVRSHLGFPDPVKASGSDEQVLAVFREVRDEIANKIPALLEQQR